MTEDPVELVIPILNGCKPPKKPLKDHCWQDKHTARVLLTECRARRHGHGFWFAFNAAQRARIRATAPAPLPAPPHAPAMPAQLDLFA